MFIYLVIPIAVIIYFLVLLLSMLTAVFGWGPFVMWIFAAPLFSLLRWIFVPKIKNEIPPTNIKE